MKLLVICRSVSDKSLAESFRMIHLINNFLENGIIIDLYLFNPDISSMLTRYIKIGRLNIYVVNQTYNAIQSLSFKLFGVPDSLIFWCCKVKKIILKNSIDYDAIFTSSPPHSLQVVGKDLSKILEIPHFVDFRDDWMGSHRLKHLTPLHSFLSQQQERSVISNATAISHAIPLVARDLKHNYPEASNKIYSIPNGFSDYISTFKGAKDSITYPKFTIAYFGGNYNNFVVNKLIKMRNDLIESNLSERWMIVSGGPFEIPYECDDLWIHYGLVDQNDVYKYIYNANIHISLLPPGDKFPSRTIPLKLYTQLTTKGACVFIGNEGATTDLFNNIEGFFHLGNNGWDNLIEWIKLHEEEIIKPKYNRSEIYNYNYKYLSSIFLKKIFPLSSVSCLNTCEIHNRLK